MPFFFHSKSRLTSQYVKHCRYCYFVLSLNSRSGSKPHRILRMGIPPQQSHPNISFSLQICEIADHSFHDGGVQWVLMVGNKSNVFGGA